MTITVPEFALVLLVGPAGCGKSTFARRHFRPTEILSSDFFRGLIADDEGDQAATPAAFEVLHRIAAERLAARRLTVIDATNVQQDARQPLLALAKKYHCSPVAIVLNLPEALCQERRGQQTGRQVAPEIIHQQHQQMRRSVAELPREGVGEVHVLTSPEAVEAVVIERRPLPCNRRNEHGPFDIIGDVHGCTDELEALLRQLGYQRTDATGWVPPPGRRAVFVGDLVDRGPRILDAIRLVQDMAAAGQAFCVPGNHDMKLVRKLKGNDVKIAHGLALSLAEIEALPPETRPAVEQGIVAFFEGLPSHLVLDDGRLVVAHAGLIEAMHGRESKAVRGFALYGQTTGESDEFGLPVRQNWAADYHGQAMVVYGHTPVLEPEWVNGTINIDTGCVFGGRLTALRYPERELVRVPAAREYAVPARPLRGVGENGLSQ